MYVDDLDIPRNKFTESGMRVIQRAFDDARRREHSLLTSAHLCLALAQTDWTLFERAMRCADVPPNRVVRGLDDHLRTMPAFEGRHPGVASTAKIVCRLALHFASRAGHPGVAPADLLLAMLEETRGVPATLLRLHGAEPDEVIPRLEAQLRDDETRGEELRRRFELPVTLRQVGTNLNRLARLDQLAPVVGREREVQQVLEVLSHRSHSNSVMLVGEPGVGKTAIAEGLARRIELEPDTVPVRLRDAQIVSVEINALVAGTMLRGMFEDRLQNVIREVKERGNLILFVDEAHTLVGAGSALGAPSDAGQILKSVLARGEIRMIGATTIGEYRQHIQEDEALARRFRCVSVAEPSIDEARRILEGLRPRLERDYSVDITDQAIDAALELSPRYMRHLRLPDKAIGWLDTAAVRAEMARRTHVSGADVVSVVSTAARIPEEMVFRDVGDRFADLERELQRHVVGQTAAVEAVARRLRLGKGPLKDGFDRPDGVLLFLGPTGVGKTELAKAVARVLFGDEKKMIRIDMSEYQDGGVSVDKLIGMPRGIEGSDRGGLLTTPLMDNPCTVILLDEIEKASPSVLNLFLQAFDEGWLTDGRGRRVYLSDALVIMTSNVGSEAFRALTNPLGFLNPPSSSMASEARTALARRMAPEFRNRIDDVVVFSPLSVDDVRRIARGYLSEIQDAMAAAGKTIEVDDDAVELIAAEGYSVEFGARFLKRVIDDRVKLPITTAWNEAPHFRVRAVKGVVVAECQRAQCAAA